MNVFNLSIFPSRDIPSVKLQIPRWIVKTKPDNFLKGRSFVFKYIQGISIDQVAGEMNVSNRTEENKGLGLRVEY